MTLKRKFGWLLIIISIGGLWLSTIIKDGIMLFLLVLVICIGIPLLVGLVLLVLWLLIVKEAL